MYMTAKPVSSCLARFPSGNRNTQYAKLRIGQTRCPRISCSGLKSRSTDYTALLPIMSKVKLFISHASEDKDDFVRPLAAELSKFYDVWYDEYSLIVGPSLLSQISKGMKECQYAIVVLSRSFFAKKSAESRARRAFRFGTRRPIVDSSNLAWRRS